MQARDAHLGDSAELAATDSGSQIVLSLVAATESYCTAELNQRHMHSMDERMVCRAAMVNAKADLRRAWHLWTAAGRHSEAIGPAEESKSRARLLRSLLASVDSYCRSDEALRSVRSEDELLTQRVAKMNAKRHLIRIWHLWTASCRPGEPTKPGEGAFTTARSPDMSKK